MTITTHFYKASLAGHLFFKKPKILEANLKIFQRTHFKVLIQNVFLNFYSTQEENNSLVKETVSISKKRLNKKKRAAISEVEKYSLVRAFCTAEEYDLEKLAIALQKFTAFKPTAFGTEFGNSIDVVHAKPNSQIDTVCQDLFFFREGSVVMWNISDSEMKTILKFVKPHEENSFVNDLVQNESEVMSYLISENVNKTQIMTDNLILCRDDNLLDKYAVSNAMALSVQLGMYEASLEKYIDTMEPVTDDLKSGNKIKMTRSEVLQKTGQLFALRHNINLNSDLLDTPDFYWDREELETLYQTTFNYYCISKRTKVINEKINHCVELVDLLSSHLNDKHHIRLEWMIIILIMVEVAFEVFHCLEYFEVFKGVN